MQSRYVVAHRLWEYRNGSTNYGYCYANTSTQGSYVVDAELMAKAPDNMIVMHPLPRVDEICPNIDSDKRAAYFRQMENGMFVRMALLALVTGTV
jgi:aspartate carbamoyltransferase catalytic subunit